MASYVFNKLDIAQHCLIALKEEVVFNPNIAER